MPFQSQLAYFAPALAALPDNFSAADPLPASLFIGGDSRFQVYYAPFDHVTLNAKIVIVGITPGRVQALAAIKTAREYLRKGADQGEASARAKSAASFAGPMRSNLVNLLDFVGIGERLGLPSTADLWSSRTDLVHFTSALRYPVFEAGRNFTGVGIDRHKILLEQQDRYFAAECAGLPHALFVPLGSAAQVACDRMIAAGALTDSRVLRGLPHPSGANAERIAYFLGRKGRDQLSVKTRPEPLDQGRSEARRIVSAWAA